VKALLDIVARHKQGERVGVYSLCSAHPRVVECALREAKACDAPLLIEATSNQVNQFGGYTGMRPADFRRFVGDIALRIGFPAHQLWLGGDHLGPNAWRAEPAAAAMAKSAQMIHDYVCAGFRKIHLDCSMTCGDDVEPLTEPTLAKRAAQLCAIAERAWREAGGEPPVYVIGTEVPVPGGATEELHDLAVTTPQAASATIAAHNEAFAEAGLHSAWARVIALVVQPGVEFDHHKVIDYVPERARVLSAFIADDPQFVFEAHSTDYQTPQHLAELVRDHFAILKVGPGATYALRETLWGLAAIARELPGGDAEEDLRKVALDTMYADPRHWSSHYRDPARTALDLQFSLSDRIRYYWPYPQIQAACESLLSRLRRTGVPLTLLSQYLPHQYEAVRAGQLPASAEALLADGIARALRPYMRACQGGTA
jgi:D-tagatose-1,6-bisphosphate aldolase subunit GatZ/KbaZ